MGACIEEHDELHGMLASRVEVLKVLFNSLDHERDILDLDVRPVLSVNAVEEVSEDDSLLVEELIFLNIKFLAFFEKKVEKEIFILVIDHSVSENSLVLMDPESHHIKRSLTCLRIS